MAGPSSPGSEGPTFAPPPLPAGWIAQWDGNSRKYYFVQLSTGLSQWDTPTDAAPVGGTTPATDREHPYGRPGAGDQLITHPDGSQTIKYSDGSMEPVMPPAASAAARGDGARGMPGEAGADGDRSIGSFAANMLQSQFAGQHHGGSNSNPLGQIISGLTHSGGGHGHSGGGGALGGVGGKLAGQLVSNLFSSDGDHKPQNYHSGQSTAQQQHSGGLAGSVMGGVAHMFGGQHDSGSVGQTYGYSNTGHTGGYTGTAPPASYQPPSQTSYNSAAATTPASSAAAHQQTPTPSYHPPPPSTHQPQNQSYSASSPTYSGQPPLGQTQQHAPSYAPPPSQGPHVPSFPPHSAAPQHYGQSPSGPPSYGAPQHQGQPSYGAPQQPYGGGTPQYYPPPPPPGQPPYGGQPSYGSQAPPIPHGSRPGYQSQGYGGAHY